MIAGLVFLALQSWVYLQPIWSPTWLTSTAVAVVYKGAILVGLLGLFLYATEPPKSKAQDAAAHVPFTSVDWQRIGVIVIISLFSIVFWMGFEQSGGTLNLFADEKTDRTIFGYDIPASVFQAINPIFIISMAPVFAVIWTYLARRNFPLPSVTKQGMGLSLLGLAFLVMYLANEGAKSGRVSPFWLISVYFIFTVAELFVSPIGLILGQQARSPEGCIVDDGLLVPVHGGRQLPRRHHGTHPGAVPPESLGFPGCDGPRARTVCCWP